MGNRVKIKTDTVYDSEGVPVSIRPGAVGRIVEVSDGWAQVLVKFTDGIDLLGVDECHLEEINE